MNGLEKPKLDALMAREHNKHLLLKNNTYCIRLLVIYAVLAVRNTNNYS